jgi:hypothetical protein
MFPGKKINLARYFISEFCHLSAGALVGVTLLLIFKYSGEKYPYDKGIGFGIFMWIIHVVVIPNIIKFPRPIVFRTELESVVDLLAHLAFGFIATIFLIKSKRNFPI